MMCLDLFEIIHTHLKREITLSLDIVLSCGLHAAPIFCQLFDHL